MVTSSMAKNQRNSTFFAKYDHFSLIDNTITFYKLSLKLPVYIHLGSMS